MSRMETVCIGCMTAVVPGDGPASPDGGAICPKCGPREAHQLVRRPVTEGSK